MNKMSQHCAFNCFIHSTILAMCRTPASARFALMTATPSALTANKLANEGAGRRDSLKELEVLYGLGH